MKMLVLRGRQRKPAKRSRTRRPCDERFAALCVRARLAYERASREMVSSGAIDAVVDLATRTALVMRERRAAFEGSQSDRQADYARGALELSNDRAGFCAARPVLFAPLPFMSWARLEIARVYYADRDRYRRRHVEAARANG